MSCLRSTLSEPTVRGFLLVGLDLPDVSRSGAPALRRAVQRTDGFDRPPTDEEMAELGDRGTRPAHW
jgi:hypothetical protein